MAPDSSHTLAPKTAKRVQKRCGLIGKARSTLMVIGNFALVTTRLAVMGAGTVSGGWDPAQTLAVAIGNGSGNGPEAAPHKVIPHKAENRKFQNSWFQKIISDRNDITS